MNIVVKSAVAGALALGATSAFAVGVPANNSSDLILIIQNVNTPADVYALDTGISINSVLPTSSLVSGSILSTAIAGINSTIAESSTLQSFLAANPAADDAWTLEAAQYLGASSVASATNQNTKTAGNGKVIFTSIQPSGNVGTQPLSNLQNIANGVQTQLTAGAGAGAGDLSALLTSTENDTTVGLTAQEATKFGVMSTGDLASLGSTAIALYGYTGNNGTGNVQSYILGSATLGTDGILTIAANPGGSTTVPLPAAVWLFGSGVLGLVGVSRRRKIAAAI